MGCWVQRQGPEEEEQGSDLLGSKSRGDLGGTRGQSFGGRVRFGEGLMPG